MAPTNEPTSLQHKRLTMNKLTSLTLNALLLAPLAALHADRSLPEVPSFGKLCASFFQALEKQGVLTPSAWN